MIFSTFLQAQEDKYELLTSRAIENGLYDSALAIGLDPEDPCAFFNRGNLHLHHREYEKALDDFNRAMSESRGDLTAWKMPKPAK